MSHRLLVGIYLAAIVAANLLAARYGPWATVIWAFLFIGLDLTTRDRLHQVWRNSHLILRMGGLIATGSILSWMLNADAGRIGLASFAAFAISQTVDAVVYHRTGSITKSNIAGAGLDSLIFPTLAFGSLMPWIVAGQFVAKVLGGELWRVVIRRQVPKPTT